MTSLRLAAAQWLLPLIAALLLGSCGGSGGVDSGGTGSPTFSSGPITGFGSVIVNGVHFDDASARVTDADGTTRSRDDLRLGMTTEIRASATSTDNAGNATSVANSIVFAADLVGPVSSVDLAAARLVVLGQQVQFNASTVFDESSLPQGAGGIIAGQTLQVYALLDAASQRYTATRIERASALPAAFRLRGTVSSLDAAARRFDVGAAHLSYASLGVTPPALSNGAIVRLRLATTPNAGVWTVLAVDDGVARPQDHDDVRVEGVINAFASATQFSVEGVAVDAARLANLPSGLGLGARVEVRGTASGTTIVATEVRLRSPQDVDEQDYELRGAISSVDAAQATFVLRGVRVAWSLTGTEFRNGGPTNLATGVNVEARGTLSANGTDLLAQRITFP